MSGGGCKTCPVKGCDAQYRGSQCAALRAKAGVDSDPMTNADRIRAMSDEELAEFIPNWSYTKACKCDEQRFVDCNNECEKCVADWLQQPAPEEGNKMYEELIQALRLHCEAGKKIGLSGAIWTLLGDASTALKSMTAQLAALQAENAELKQRVEAKEAILKLYEPTLSLVSGDKDTAIYRMRKAESALSRVEAERDAAQKCIYDVETYLELGSGAYIVKTIQAWKNDAQGEG